MELGRLGDPPSGRALSAGSGCLPEMRVRRSIFLAEWATEMGTPAPAADCLPREADSFCFFRCVPELLALPLCTWPRSSSGTIGSPGCPGSPGSSGTGSLRRGRFLLGSAAAGRCAPEEAAAGAGDSKGELLALILAEGLLTAGRFTPERAAGVSRWAVRPSAASALFKMVAFTGMPHSSSSGLSHRAGALYAASHFQTSMISWFGPISTPSTAGLRRAPAT